MNSVPLFPVDDLSFRRLLKPSGDTNDGSLALFGVLGGGFDRLIDATVVVVPSELDSLVGADSSNFCCFVVVVCFLVCCLLLLYFLPIRAMLWLL